MKILCVANAIKETLCVRDVQRALMKGVAYTGCADVKSLLMSDGGDGFADAFMQSEFSAVGFWKCQDPLGRERYAGLIWDKDRCVVLIESADVIGLKLIEPKDRSIMESGTAGLGDLVFEAIDGGAQEIFIGLGGSATCDGGAGFLVQLAQRFGLKVNLSSDFRGTPRNLMGIDFGFLSVLRERIHNVKLYALADVKNLLLGKSGSAHTFARQKGASYEEIEELERLMERFAGNIEAVTEMKFSDKEGAGAAGGLGFAIMACGGEVLQGSEYICRRAGFEQMVTGDCHVITCEGKFDMTSLSGKAPGVIAKIARASGAKVTVFCAIADEDAVTVAKMSGIGIVEFGRDISPCERKTKTFDALVLRISETLAAC